MGDFGLAVELREARGKGVARKLRAIGRIPGVCYRRNAEPAAISLDRRELDLLLRRATSGLNTLIDLSVAGGGDFDGRQVLIKELQRDAITGEFLHADLYAVDLQQKIHVSVPIHIKGTAIGVTLGGGILDHATRELDVECLPNAIPEEIAVDVSAIEIGDSIHVRDLAIPEGVAVLNDPDVTIVSVVAPTVEEVAEATAEVAAEGEAAAPAAADATAGESAEKKGDD